MQDCPCGGDLKWLTSKGIDYRQCKSCGRNDYPERIRNNELVVVKGDSPSIEAWPRTSTKPGQLIGKDRPECLTE